MIVQATGMMHSSRHVLKAIEMFLERGYQPTQRQIMDETGYSKPTVERAIRHLKRTGLISVTHSKPDFRRCRYQIRSPE